MFSPLVLLEWYRMQMLNTSNARYINLKVHTNEFYKVIYHILMDTKEQKELENRKKAAKSSAACDLKAVECTTSHSTHTLCSVDLNDNNITANNVAHFTFR